MNQAVLIDLTRPHVRKGIVQWTALEREPHTV